jgi:hypothetical protein
MVMIPGSQHGPTSVSSRAIALAAVLFISECASVPVVASGLLMRHVIHQRAATPAVPAIHGTLRNTVQHRDVLFDLLTSRSDYV